MGGGTVRSDPFLALTMNQTPVLIPEAKKAAKAGHDFARYSPCHPAPETYIVCMKLWSLISDNPTLSAYLTMLVCIRVRVRVSLFYENAFIFHFLFFFFLYAKMALIIINARTRLKRGPVTFRLLF